MFDLSKDIYTHFFHKHDIYFWLVSEYNDTFKLQIDRKSRSFARVIERKGIKLDVYYTRWVHDI